MKSVSPGVTVIVLGAPLSAICLKEGKVITSKYNYDFFLEINTSFTPQVVFLFYE